MTESMIKKKKKNLEIWPPSELNSKSPVVLVFVTLDIYKSLLDDPDPSKKKEKKKRIFPGPRQIS